MTRKSWIYIYILKDLFINSKSIWIFYLRTRLINVNAALWIARSRWINFSSRRKDNHNILNKFCFISRWLIQRKTHDCILAELRFITIFLVHRTGLLLQKYRSRHIGYYRVRKRSWIPVAYAPVRCAQSVVVTNWAGNCDTRIWFWCNQLNVTRQCMLNVSWISQDLAHGICIAVQSLSCHKVDIY